MIGPSPGELRIVAALAVVGLAALVVGGVALIWWLTGHVSMVVN